MFRTTQISQVPERDLGGCDLESVSERPEVMPSCSISRSSRVRSKALGLICRPCGRQYKRPVQVLLGPAPRRLSLPAGEAGVEAERPVPLGLLHLPKSPWPLPSYRSQVCRPVPACTDPSVPAGCGAASWAAAPTLLRPGTSALPRHPSTTAPGALGRPPTGFILLLPSKRHLQPAPLHFPAHPTEGWSPQTHPVHPQGSGCSGRPGREGVHHTRCCQSDGMKLSGAPPCHG